MRTLRQELSDWTEAAFRASFPESSLEELSPEALPSADERHGDYQCNAAMKLARELKQPPRRIAETVSARGDLPSIVARLEPAGPGFLNFHLDEDRLARRLEAVAEDERLGVPAEGQGRRMVLDYSSPNVAKPMHIGHIRSTVIGAALDRLHRFLGWQVVSDNHLGDWGTQFGILMLGYQRLVNERALREAPVEELERVYRVSYERTREDPAWLDEARAELVRLQAGDPDRLALWRHFVDLSKGEFARIYKRLDVRFDLERGESFYHGALPGIIERLERAGLTEVSEGALIVRLEEEGLPVSIVRKSDGGFNYTTTDLATVWSRAEEFHPDLIVYVTDERQQLHFKQLFALCRRLDCPTELKHVWFGLMRLPEGTFSTREGNVIRLEKLLDEAEARALALVRSSSPDMPEDQQREVARAAGIGAVKYADLSQNPQSLVTFTWEKALSLEGNSAPYLQYAHARIASVRDKYAERFPGRDFREQPIRLAEPVERGLGLRLARFPEACLAAAAAFRPNLLADYLYDLAQTYSSFYQNVPFLKAEDGVRESRVRLCDLTARTLRQGLGLLGIETPDRI